MPTMQPIIEVDREVRSWAMAAHIVSFVGYVIPFGNIIGPLFIWLLKKEASPFIDHHGKESLNFQISLTIYYVIAGLLVFILIGFVLLALLFCAHVILSIMAGVRAYNGESFRYPMTIRFIR